MMVNKKQLFRKIKKSERLAGIKIITTFVPVFDVAFLLIRAKVTNRGPDGGIGRRVGLKHQWGNTRAGSIPALGTLES